MTKYVPKHAVKRFNGRKRKAVITTSLISATVLGVISPLASTSKVLLADSVSEVNIQRSTATDITENDSQSKEGLKPASNQNSNTKSGQVTTTAKSVQQSNNKKPAAIVKGYAQFGTLKVNMVDSTGYVYKAGTIVARSASSANGGEGNYFMDLVLMAFPGFVQGQGFGQIPEEYVTAGATKAYDVDTEGDGTWVIKDNYITNAGRGETFKPQGVVDKSKLKSKLDEAQTYIDKADQYTADSIENLKIMIGMAKGTYNDLNASQKQVDDSVIGLTNAISKLVKVGNTDVNKDALANAIKDANDALTNSDKYTDDSVKALNDALAKANSVYSDKNATQEQVDAATKALNDAIAGLTEKPTNPVDVNKDALASAIKDANDALTNSDKYTDDSVKALNDALAKANSVYSDKNATQEQVDAATKALNDAIAGLTEKTVDPSNPEEPTTPGNDNNNPGNTGNNSSNSNNNNNDVANNSGSNTGTVKGNGSKTGNSDNVSGKKTLPQTGDANTSLLSTLGLMAMSILGWFGVTNKRKNI